MLKNKKILLTFILGLLLVVILGLSVMSSTDKKQNVKAKPPVTSSSVKQRTSVRKPTSTSVKTRVKASSSSQPVPVETSSTPVPSSVQEKVGSPAPEAVNEVPASSVALPTQAQAPTPTPSELQPSVPVAPETPAPQSHEDPPAPTPSSSSSPLFLGWVKDEAGQVIASATFSTYEEAGQWATAKANELAEAAHYGVSPA